MGAGASQDWRAAGVRGHAFPGRAAPGADRDPAGKLSDVAAAHSPARATSAWRPKEASSGGFRHRRNLQSKASGILGESICPRTACASVAVFHWRLSMDRYTQPRSRRIWAPVAARGADHTHYPHHAAGRLKLPRRLSTAMELQVSARKPTRALRRRYLGHRLSRRPRLHRASSTRPAT